MDMDNRMGQVIRARRQALGYSQEELAELMSEPQATSGKLNVGTPFLVLTY